MVESIQAAKQEQGQEKPSWVECCELLGGEISRAAQTAMPPSEDGLEHEEWSSKWVEASTESMDAFDELTGPLLSCFIWQSGINSVRRSLLKLAAGGETESQK